MTNYNILEMYSSNTEAFTFLDKPEKTVELGYSTYATSGIEDFIKHEITKTFEGIKVYDVLGEVTITTNDGASINCEALIYVGAIPGSLEFHKNNDIKWVNKTGLIIKINTDDATSINIDDVKYIKYKNYVFNSSKNPITDKSLNTMYDFAYFIIDSIEEDTFMNNFGLAIAYVRYIKGLYSNAFTTSSKSNKVLSKLNKDLYLVTKTQFDNMYKNINASKYNINVLVSSIDRVERDIMVDTNDNKIYHTWRIWFKKLDNVNVIYDGMLEVSEGGMYRKKLNGVWKNIPEHEDHLKIKINLWNIRITLEKLIGVASDIYNNCMLNNYENVICNVKSGLGSCSLCRDLAIKQVIRYDDIEYCSNAQNLEHGRFIRSIIRATGKIYSISIYDDTFYKLIKSFRDKISFEKFVNTYLVEAHVCCLSNNQFISTHKI